MALIARKAITRFLQRLHERRIRARVAAVEAARKARKRAAAASAPNGAGSGGVQGGGAAGSGGGAGGGYVGDREPDTCVICLEDNVDTVFTQCGHMCCCVGCGLGLDKCPICRIKGRAIKVYKP